MRPQDGSIGLRKFTNMSENLESMCIIAVLSMHEANADKLHGDTQVHMRLGHFNSLTVVYRTTGRQIKTEETRTTRMVA